MRKRTIASLLALVMVLSLAACGGSGSGSADDPSSPSDEGPVAATTPDPVLDPLPERGPMPSDEYERAVWYGLAERTDNPDRNVTQGEFYAMLTRLVDLYKPESMETWLSISYVKDADDAGVFRSHAAIQLLYAAEAMGIAALPDGGYPTMNADTVDWGVFCSMDWGQTSGWSEEVFSEVSEAMTSAWVYDVDPLSHYHGGVNFAASRLSRVSGKPLLDVDPQNGYIRQSDRLTCREAAVAVLRLYESNDEIAALFPEEPASAAAVQEVLAKAEDRRQAILHSETQAEYTGKAYYISNSGDDGADGTSPETAWSTISRLNTARLNGGDAVFFERGGVWRGEMIVPQPYVTYSAYGEGNKPRLIGSPENGADPDKWTLLEGTDNIWVFYRDMLDCGMIVLDEKTVAKKVLGFWNGTQYLDYVGPNDQTIGDAFTPEDILGAKPFVVTEQLTRDLTFFSQADSELPDCVPVYLSGTMVDYEGEMLIRRTRGPLYLRCDTGNPGSVYSSIEFVTPVMAFDCLEEGCVLDNIFIGFTESAIDFHSNQDVTVRNCEIAWIGGCVISYGFEDHDGNPRGALRVGGGINGAASGGTFQDNYLHEIYEEALMVETFPSHGRDIEDIRFTGNLVYHAGCGMGYFNWGEQNMFRNLLFDNNIVLFTGMSSANTGNQRCAFAIDGMSNPQEGCAFRDNVFLGSRDCLLYWNELHPETMPEFSGNQYIQYNSYPVLFVNEGWQKHWSGDAEHVVRDILGDKTGSYTTLYSFCWDNLDW